MSHRKNVCPCCGQIVETDVLVSLDANSVSRQGMTVHLPPQGAELLYALNEARPNVVSHQRLDDILYGRRNIERRSTNPHLVVRVCLSDIRRRLKRLRIGIIPAYGEGYRMVLE